MSHYYKKLNIHFLAGGQLSLKFTSTLRQVQGPSSVTVRGTKVARRGKFGCAAFSSSSIINLNSEAARRLVSESNQVEAILFYRHLCGKSKEK